MYNITSFKTSQNPKFREPVEASPTKKARATSHFAHRRIQMHLHPLSPNFMASFDDPIVDPRPMAEASPEIKKLLVLYQATYHCPDIEWSSLLHHAQHLFIPSMNFDALASILNHLRHIKENKRASCVKHAKLLVDNMVKWETGSQEIGSLLSLFAEMHENEHAIVVKYTKLLLKESKREYIATIVKTFALMPEDARESCVTHAKPFITASMYG